MKKKLFIFILVITAVICGLCAVSACKNTVNTIPDVKDGIDGVDGKDGLGIKNIQLNDDGELVITYTDETSVNLGKITGNDGIDGADGVDGSNGSDGKDGLGVMNIIINSDGELVITYTDDTSVNLGKMTGNDGVDGVACVHNYSDWTVGLLPTCTSIGYNIRNCTLCGDTDYDFVQATGHNWDSGTEAIQATCTEYGLKIYKCIDCNANRVVRISPISHSYVDGECVVCHKTLTSDGLEFSLNDGGQSYSVKGLGDNSDSDIIIPDTYEGLPVTAILSQAFRESGIRAISIPASITEIGEDAFRSCSTLTDLYYRGNIEDWCNISFMGGYRANPLSRADNFYVNNELITQLIIPGSVEKIGDYAFSHCYSITSLTISEGVKSIGNCAFEWCTGITDLKIADSVTYIGYRALCLCRNLNNVVIPGGVTYIGDNAFYGNNGLTSVVLSEGLTYIGNKMFATCRNLKSITIPDTVTHIDEFAFYSCTSLESITIPKSVEVISKSAFGSCTSVENVYYQGDAADWCKINFLDSSSNPLYRGTGDLYFNGKFVTQLIIPAGVDRISDYAFTGCRSLIDVVISGGVTSVGKCSFYSCDNLKNVIIFDGVEEIDEYAFSYCGSLESINIPKSLTTIGELAFNRCNSLSNVLFEDKEGWCRTVVTLASDPEISDGVKYLAVGELENTSYAASLLRSIYVLKFPEGGYSERGYEWTKTISE